MTPVRFLNSLFKTTMFLTYYTCLSFTNSHLVDHVNLNTQSDWLLVDLRIFVNTNTILFADSLQIVSDVV